MPHLSEKTEPLQSLEEQAEWQWLTQHSIAFNTVKKYLTESPVLKYYNINEEVTIQCDALARELSLCRTVSWCVVHQER